MYLGALSLGDFAPGIGRILQYTYNCSGEENALKDCVQNAFEQCVSDRCAHAHDAGVVCNPGESESIVTS